MFFALKGENFDGNKYAKDALDNGASYAVVDDPTVAINESFILVEDVLKQLQELANYHRVLSNAIFIGLTGSNGKTTTKELIFEVLNTTFRTQCTQGNYNNHIGVPLTLLGIRTETEFAVIEMGANHQKEIEFLCGISDPDFGYITNFGKAHLEGFGGIEGVIKGKSELYTHLKNKDGYIFVNANDKKQLELTSGYDKCILFNNSDRPSLSPEFITSEPFVKFKLGNMVVSTRLTGYYNFHNISVAVAIGKYFGVKDENIAEAISAYQPENNRSQVLSFKNHTIVLDAYNANPSSMSVALKNFEKFDTKKKAVILGDMFELGSTALEEHQNMADLANGLDIDKIILIGDHFSRISLSGTNVSIYNSFDDFKKQFDVSQIDGFTLLIKGSRGMALERVLEIL